MPVVFPEILHCLQENNPEKLSFLVRKYFGNEQCHSHRPDITRIIQNAGISITRKSTAWHGALVCKDQRGTLRANILYDPATEQNGCRFLLAHLLGHYFLEIQKEMTGKARPLPGFGEDISPQLRYENQIYDNTPGSERERAADLFAASLLMPAEMFIKASQSLKSDPAIGAFFLVSEKSVKRRASLLAVDEEARPAKPPAKPPLEKDAIPSSEPSRPGLNETPPGGKTHKPFNRLRQLAKKLDKSVEI